MRQLALAAETPLDAASRHHDAGDVPAEVLLQSGPPWRKLAPIVDHGKPSPQPEQFSPGRSHDARGFDTTRQASLRSVGNAPFNLDGPSSPRILDCEKYKLDRPLAQAPAKLPHEWGFPAQRIRQRRPQLTSGLANHSGAGAWSTALRWPSYSIDVSDATTPRLWRHANSAWSPTPSITCRTASWPCGHPAPPLSGVQVRYAFFFRWDVPRFTRCLEAC